MIASSLREAREEADMQTVIAIAFFFLVLVVAGTTALWRQVGLRAGANVAADPASSLSVNDVLLGVDAKSLPGGEFDDPSLVFPGAPGRSKTSSPPQIPESRK
jgi:hypothetical protein